jgi:hypothetical protein
MALDGTCYYGVDESGFEEMIIVACRSKDSAAIEERTKLPKRRNGRIQFDLYNFKFTILTRNGGDFSIERLYAIGNLLANYKLTNNDIICVDAFGSLRETYRDTLHEVLMKDHNIFIPKNNVIFKQKADSQIPLVNDADKIAYQLFRCKRDHGEEFKQLEQIYKIV